MIWAPRFFNSAKASSSALAALALLKASVSRAAASRMARWEAFSFFQLRSDMIMMLGL
jgi:hypothetical protein